MGKFLGGFWKPDKAAYMATINPKRRNKRKQIKKLKEQRNGFKRYKANAFLDGDQWKKLRYQALLKYGRRCMCCGALPINGVILHVDHVKPRSKFPELALDINNLQILCEQCNIGKGAWDMTDFRIKVLNKEEF